MSHDELCLVLRDVPLDLSEGEIIGALGVHCARRFVRTASRPPRPLRLVRVECRDGAQRAALLSDGSVVLRGVCCPIETPKCTSQSAAAVGRTVLTPEALQKMLSAVGAASALYPEDNSLRSPIPGEIVFCRHGRFHRGYHAVVRDVIDRGRSFAIAREGKQQRQQQPQQQRQQQQQQQSQSCFGVRKQQHPKHCIQTMGLTAKPCLCCWLCAATPGLGVCFVSWGVVWA